jgi:predicted dehydrogenase
MPMRVLITGRGSIAQRHVRHLRQQRPDVVFTVVSGSGEVDASLQPCEIAADFVHGLQNLPDAVIIASVSSRHADELRACLEAGLPCLVEKPLATQRAALDAVRAASLNGKPHNAVAVGCNLRFLPVLSRVRAMLRENALGTLVRAHLEVGQELAQWRPSREAGTTYSADAAQGGGVVFDLVHEIDMAVWLLGPLAVRGAVSGQLGALAMRADDVHVALLQRVDERGRGEPVTISLDYVSLKPARRYVFVGTKGTLTCDLIGHQLTLDGRGGHEVIDLPAQDFDLPATYNAQMRDWLGAVGSPAHALVSPLVEALITAELMLAMKAASA